MEPVTCGRCGTTVLVSKYSAEQTSIQWQGSSDSCALHADLNQGDTCPDLSDAIRDAVLAGQVEVSARVE